MSSPPPAPRRTVVASVPPPPEQSATGAAPVPDQAADLGRAYTQHAGSGDFQETRQTRIGAHMQGSARLEEPKSEQKRLRLVAGRVVPGTRYRILRWLGEGGMGVVYEAEHIDIERRVALKILRFDLSQEAKMAQVFRDEARAASRIGSKNIVEIYDFGELEDGRLFFCMELLDGQDLVPASEDDWVQPPQLIGILRQTCKGLHAAHKAGIVHRDIKPENIIVVNDEGREIVKLVDFGISAMLAASDDSDGTIAGTPHYMAPEQISGAQFDGRLDIYALGCMAYELLVGRPPFLADEIEDLLKMQLVEEPTPIRQVRPDRDIPQALADVIMRCLAKNPAERFRDMADLEAAICEAQIAAKLHTNFDDLPLPEVDEQRREVLLRDMPSPLSELARERKPKLLVPLLAGVGALIAGVGITFFLMGGEPTQAERDQIEELTIAARNAAALTHYVYPPLEEPKASTAYTKVLQLEDLEGNADEHGDKRAGELRGQFAETLVALGDRYYDLPQARSFAIDYYIQALLFDETHATALERSGATFGTIQALREKAANGEFSPEELGNARWLAALAVEDADQMSQELAEIEVTGDAGSAMLAGRALATAKKRGAKVPRGTGVAGSEGGDGDTAGETADSGAGTGPAAGDTAGGGDTAGEGEGETEGEELVEEQVGKKGGKKGGAKLGSHKRDPEKSRQLVEEGMAALKSGRRGEAERLFNQAIASDRRNAKALMGLSDIYFDTGANQKAVLYAERAVQAAPKNQGYRLGLGDAYYKVLRYRDALEQYQKAKSLGSSRADQRIAKVKAKIGG